jgi:hypothetical protein
MQTTTIVERRIADFKALRSVLESDRVFGTERFWPLQNILPKGWHNSRQVLEDVGPETVVFDFENPLVANNRLVVVAGWRLLSVQEFLLSRVRKLAGIQEVGRAYHAQNAAEVSQQPSSLEKVPTCVVALNFPGQKNMSELFIKAQNGPCIWVFFVTDTFQNRLQWSREGLEDVQQGPVSLLANVAIFFFRN